MNQLLSTCLGQDFTEINMEARKRRRRRHYALKPVSLVYVFKQYVVFKYEKDIYMLLS